MISVTTTTLPKLKPTGFTIYEAIHYIYKFIFILLYTKFNSYGKTENSNWKNLFILTLLV